MRETHFSMSGFGNQYDYGHKKVPVLCCLYLHFEEQSVIGVSVKTCKMMV